MKELKLNKIFLNYYVLGGANPQINSDNPFISFNAYDKTKSIFMNKNNEGGILKEAYDFLSKIEEESIIIMENPEKFINIFTERYKETFQEDPTEILVKFKYLDIGIDIEMHEKLFMVGYQSSFDTDEIVEWAFNNDFNKIKNYMKINLILNEKIFTTLMSNNSKHNIGLRSSINKNITEKIKHQRDILDKRLFEIEELKEEAFIPEVGTNLLGEKL